MSVLGSLSPEAMPMSNLIVLTIVLICTASITVLVLYAVGKIRSLEEITRQLMDQQGGAGSSASGGSNVPFNGLQGKPLWDMLAGKSVPEGLNAADIEQFREQYVPVLLKTIRSLFAEGCSDGKFGAARATPKSERLVKTLRFAVSSWLPSQELNSLYNVAYDSARAQSEELNRLRMALEETIATLYGKIKLPVPTGLAGSLLSEARSVETLASDTDAGDV
jgi:hypothetical protein